MNFTFRLKLLLVGLFFAIGCLKKADKPSDSGAQNQDQKSPVHLEIDVVGNFNNKKVLNLSDYAKDIRYVRLEMFTENLIEDINHLELTSEFIFISTFKNGLLQFDRNGGFVRKIGEHGWGPGEYIFLLDFVIDAVREKIYVLPNFKREMMVFDFKGDFLHKVDLSLDGRFLGLINGDYILATTGDSQKKYAETESEEKKFNFFLYDLEGRIIKKFERETIRDNNLPKFVIAKTNFQATGDHFILNEYLSNNVYSLDSELKLKKIITCDFGSWQSPVDIIIPPPKPGENVFDDILGGKYVFLFKAKQLANSIFISFKHSNIEHKAVFDKELDQLIFCEEFEEGLYSGLKNDLDGGLPFWPEYVIGDSLMIMPINAYEILDYFDNQPENISKHGSLQFLNGLTKNDNPVLVFASMN